MKEQVLVAENLSKSFDKQSAVEHLNLEVGAGEFVALLGPNGAGKTTLLQMLTGLFAPDRGSVRVAGHDVRRESSAALAALGVVFQQPSLDLEMSAARNLRFHARLHGLRHRLGENRIAEALEAVDLRYRADDRTRTLSGGNRRRVEVARALLHKPQLLLMDEASAGLDPASRRDLLARVNGECRRRGLAVLWATHLVEEAEEADRVLVMDSGRIRANASPSELLLQTKSRELADAFFQLTETTNHPLTETA